MTGPFTDEPGYDRDAVSVVLDGLTLTARCEHDQDHGAPWDEECGHGPVSGWRSRVNGNPDKYPGELVLHADRWSDRFYDYQEACATALRDGWGVPSYRMDYEVGQHQGLHRATGQWFEGRTLLSFTSPWCDDINDAIRDVYAQHRATFPSARAYAAVAARADFERLKAWCEDDWWYVGVIVEVSKNGIELGSASLWGIESDAGEYLTEVANDLVDEAVAEAKATLVALCDCEEARDAA